MGDIIRTFCSEDGLYMCDLSNLNHELGNLSLGDWPKDYLHQFLLQAQGWEFSCYSIASACRCLHKLELSLFREGNQYPARRGHADSQNSAVHRALPPPLWRPTVKLQQHVCFQEVFCACYFTLSHAGTQSHPRTRLKWPSVPGKCYSTTYKWLYFNSVKTWNY